ncbi:MAG: glucosaminidase domain-containing protein [Bacteroidales bacterium]|nr:glucosaminidase domain-containing protein [Bacteroidales bacterium]
MKITSWYIRLFFCLIPLLSFTENEERKSTGSKTAYRELPSIFIMDKGAKPVQSLYSFFYKYNLEADSAFLINLIRTYIKEAELEGINYEVAFCQMCLETGFLRFSGSVSRFQNNFCGLGAVNAATAGDWFNSVEEGVRAHIQHLKAYASVEPVKTELVDKRFHKVRRGLAFTIFDLAGRWAMDPHYGSKISYLLKRLYEE